MPSPSAVEVQPIHDSDVEEVARFLNRELNTRVTPQTWAAAMRPSWAAPGSERGLQLRVDGDLVGVYLAYRSPREIDGRTLSFCNLAAFCVRQEHRAHGLRLLRGLMRQKDVHFTDFSPSGSVVELNRRLGFKLLEGATHLSINLPLPHVGVRVLDDAEDLRSRLMGPQLKIFRDHERSPAAVHLLAVRGEDQCYVIFRRDRRKNLPLFASILFVSDPALFTTFHRTIGRYLLTKHHLPLMLTDTRLAPGRSLPGHRLREARPKMFKSVDLESDQIDYLYSELTEVPW